MALYINTNIGSLNAQNSLATSQMSLQTSLQRLSSGLRINSAKDDAAGLAISTRMTSQINGLSQAAQNANDGISLSQTAEGGMTTIADNLQRMRSLAVQAANGTNSASDRASIQQEIIQLQNNISQVATQTQYNGTNLLDGTLNNAQFQVGANANQTINVTVGNLQASSIGNNLLSSATAYAGAGGMTTATAGAANSFGAGTVTVSGNGATITTASIVAGGTAASIASAINSAAGSTGVTASASTTATLGSFTGSGAISLTLAGNNGTSVIVNGTMSSSTDVTGLTSAINAQSGTTGISAVANTATGQITLTNALGNNISVTNTAGSTGVTSVTLSGSRPDGTADAGVALGNTGVQATVGGLVSFSSASAYAVSTTGTNFLSSASAQGSSLNAVGAIDVTQMNGQTPTGANSAISAIDAALLYVNNQEANMGAVQNRFTSVISNLNTAGQNLTSARSLIQDTNFASETANLARSQILQQAGTAMLAQANSMPNGVMALLK